MTDTMDARTAAALEESIVHWTEIRDAEMPTDVCLGPKECALCALFIGRNCFWCPIAERTNLTRCSGTPYDEAYDAFDDWEWWDNPASEAAKARWRAAAQAMLDFLISLRPKAAAEREAV